MDLDTLYRIFRRSSGVTTDSRKCAAGSLFFALKGDTFDGQKMNLRKFIDMAFDPMKDYLWPIPESERIALPQITQNPGYAGYSAE